MTSLITGITGFVGAHLIDLLRRHGQRVAGIDMWPSFSADGVEYAPISILDTAALTRFFAHVKPARIYHLAGVSYLPDADATPRNALETNILGLVAILDAARSSCPQARVLVVGSSKEYGSGVASESIPEATHPQPTDFYGISKYAAELIGRQYVRQYAMDVRFSRSFNHTGPGQSPRFVCSDWARQVAAIELKLQKPEITVGDMRPHIDFSDVRDVSRAYRTILDKGEKGGMYNVCSGTPVSLEHVLGHLTAKCSRKVRIIGTAFKSRDHKASPRLAGDNGRLRKLGWKPRFAIENTLDDLFAYWMRELAGRKSTT